MCNCSLFLILAVFCSIYGLISGFFFCQGCLIWWRETKTKKILKIIPKGLWLSVKL